MNQGYGRVGVSRYKLSWSLGLGSEAKNPRLSPAESGTSQVSKQAGEGM